MSELKYLVAHCLATPEGRVVTKADVLRMHTSPVSQGGRGWKKAGYSDLIYLDGSLVNIIPFNQDDKVDPWEVSNGVRGLNGISRHYAYVGGVAMDGKTPKDTRTPDQKVSEETYVKYMVLRHPHIKVLGHYQAKGANKACPSYNVPNWLRSIGIPEKNIYKP